MNIPILGYCPACGQDKLFVPEVGGTILCLHHGCPEPTAVHDILSDPEVKHLLKVTEDGWTLRHPLIEDRLMNCAVHELPAEMSVGRSLPEPGVYRVTSLVD